MMKAAADINWAYPGDGIPAFVTIMVMPFTYSIAYGLIAGIITYIVLNVGVWVIKKASGGRIVPYGEEMKDPWTWKIPGGFFPKWVVRASRGDKTFWKSDEIDGESNVDGSARRSGSAGGAEGNKYGEPFAEEKKA